MPRQLTSTSRAGSVTSTASPWIPNPSKSRTRPFGSQAAARPRCAGVHGLVTGGSPICSHPERLAASIERINALTVDADRQGAIEYGIYLPFVVHEKSEAAKRIAADTLSEQYHQDFSALVDKYALAGDPQDCVRRLTEYIDAGATTIILGSAADGEQAKESQSMLASQVIATLRQRPNP